MNWAPLALWVGVCLSPAMGGCKQRKQTLAPRGQSFAELRTIKRGVTIEPASGKSRSPYFCERLADGDKVRLAKGALVWLRRDAGATFLVRGPADFTLRKSKVEFRSGQVFVDTLGSKLAHVGTPQGQLTLAAVRASLQVGASTKAYVLRGEVRSPKGHKAQPGQELTLAAGKPAQVSPRVAWEDWTGGLATTDLPARGAPYGVGTVGARTPGEKGQARFPLAIHSLHVRVKIDHDFAITEVDQTFFNPSNHTVEGLYSFRTPRDAVLHRFAVDRNHRLIWGRVKEEKQAKAQYESHVYVGSTENPALLAWKAPGQYGARLYPIKPGGTRRVVVRYGQWLHRQGEEGKRRLYVYPMAAQGAEHALPQIEELRIEVDLSAAAATRVRAGMEAEHRSGRLLVRKYDVKPRADFALELFDTGKAKPLAYRAAHKVEFDMVALDERQEAAKAARGETDYVIVPVKPTGVAEPKGGLDVGIVVDASAATGAESLRLASAVSDALLAHLGKDDRAFLWAGDAQLHPVLEGQKAFRTADVGYRRALSAALADLPQGGATDLGEVLSAAARKLDPKRRSILVYVGDGRPTVGELAIVDLRKRLGRVTTPLRLFTVGVGQRSQMGLLKAIAQGGFAQRVSDGYGAAMGALRILEKAERPVVLGAKLDLGTGIERVYPRSLSSLPADEISYVVGRVKGDIPKSLKLSWPGGSGVQMLQPRWLADDGDLKRRWAMGRLNQLLGNPNTGRAAVVEVGTRYGLLTPYTSYYVPTSGELAKENAQMRAMGMDADSWGGEDKEEDNKEGGTGTRAKGAPNRRRGLLERIADSMRSSDEKARKSWHAPPPPPEPESAEEATKADDTSASTISKSTGRRYGVKGKKKGEAQAKLKAALNRAKDASKRPRAAAAGKPKPEEDARSEKETSEGRMGNVYPARRRRAAPGDPLAGISDAPRRGPVPTATNAPREGGDVERKPASKVTTLPPKSAAKGNWDRDDSFEDKKVSGLRNNKNIGTGSGGGGIGLGSIGGIGHGYGKSGGKWANSRRRRTRAVVLRGEISQGVVNRIVRSASGRFFSCSSKPRFRHEATITVPPNGQGAQVGSRSSHRLNGKERRCMKAVLRGLNFPSSSKPTVAKVIVAASSSRRSKSHAKERVSALKAKYINLAKVNAAMPKSPRRGAGWVGHQRRFCSATSRLPLGSRVRLWKERLSSVHDAYGARRVYRQALARCEAPSWQSRRLLIGLMLNALPQIPRRVRLLRLFRKWKTVHTYLYKGILARIRTSEQLAQLHRSLGISQANTVEVEKALEKAKSPGDKVATLLKFRARWPDDLSLALRLLGAMEDAKQWGKARALGRSLRRRPDASAYVRTAVGEFYLRMAGRKGGDKTRDTAEARRTFGEIVEFSPDDPAARRRLGDLLRSHGWHSAAYRQYETLKAMAPDDPSVPLLLASAAFGMGKTEQAVRWSQKASRINAPDGAVGSAKTARAYTALFLAWARKAAAEKKNQSLVGSFRGRAKVLTARDWAKGGGMRLLVSYSHPELHPVLWSESLGSMLPARASDPSLGIAQANLSGVAAGKRVALKFDAISARVAARLQAPIILTLLVNEGQKNEKIFVKQVKVASSSARQLRFEVSAAGIKEVNK